MSTALKPEPQIWLRRILFVVAMIPLLFSSMSWYVKPVAAVMPAFLLGSYRLAYVSEGSLYLQMVVMFLPLRLRRYPLNRIVAIETKWTDAAHAGWFLMFGLYWLWCRLFDWLVPWMGGSYELWVRSAKGKRVLVWQGNSDEIYQENLELLHGAAGVPIEPT